MESIEMYEKLFHNDDLEDLCSLYYRVDREVEKQKGRRIALVFVGYIVACSFIVIVLAQPSSIAAILGCLLVSALVSALLFWISFSVFNWLFQKNLQDNERREHIELRIKLAKKRQQPK